MPADDHALELKAVALSCLFCLLVQRPPSHFASRDKTVETSMFEHPCDCLKGRSVSLLRFIYLLQNSICE